MEIFDSGYVRKDGEQEIFEKIEEACKNKIAFIYYGFPFIEANETKIKIKSILICKNGIFVYYSTNEEKKKYRRFLINLFTGSDKLYELYENNENIFTFYNSSEIEHVVDLMCMENDVMSVENLDELNMMIQKTFGLTKKDERSVTTQNSIGGLIKLRNNRLYKFDSNQFKMVYNDVDSHIRIIGLAGSGKTILLAKKMAYLHYKNPELKMVYVFYTLSLKQFVRDLFVKFYRDFDKINEPNLNNVLFLHSWGGMKAEGFYTYVCKHFNVESKTYSDVLWSKNKYSTICEELFESIKSVKDTGIFDKIFVDEAQDFPLSFFLLAKKVLKIDGNLIYAYDELQSLNDTDASMPTKIDIFGEEKCEDINLQNCYRTPNKILITAHAFGLGVYDLDENGNVKWANMVQDLNVWNSIGYFNETGIIKLGKNVSLYRKEVKDYEVEDSVQILELKNEEQYIFVVNEIFKLIKNEDVLPEDIMIIDLDSINVTDNYLDFRSKFYEYFDNNNDCVKIHIVNKDNALRFKVNNSIPYTTIFRAKGNEANIVFVLNAQSLNHVKSFSRNRIFTAMTRAKFKVYLLGNNISNYISEYGRIKENNFKLVFKYPNSQELSNLKIIAKQENKAVNNYERILELFKNFKGNKEFIKDIIMMQTGQKDYDGIKEYMEGLFNDSED